MTDLDFTIATLGEGRYASPMRASQFVAAGDEVLYHGNLAAIQPYLARGERPHAFELAGPRRELFFQPGTDLRAGIVTCGGLCPGMNDVIRAVVLSLTYHYGVQTIYGFRYGYEGLNLRWATGRCC